MPFALGGGRTFTAGFFVYGKREESGLCFLIFGKLVRKYGSGQGAEIDNYYHSLLQCELAKISQESQRNGILLGYAKEVADYVKKRSNGQNRKVILEDSRKDLQNNMYGSKLGERNKNKPCEWLLENRKQNGAFMRWSGMLEPQGGNQMRPGGRRNGQSGRASFGKKKRESGCGCGPGRRRLRLRFCALRACCF